MGEPGTEAKPEAYARCHCGTRVEVAPEIYGTGYVGRIRDACEPCWTRAEEQKERDEWKDYAYGPGPAVFDGDF
jgi:hypothetical protein